MQPAQQEVAAMKQDIMAVFEAMPRDLQHTVLSSPGRATMLHRLSLPRTRVRSAMHDVVIHSGLAHHYCLQGLTLQSCSL